MATKGCCGRGQGGLYLMSGCLELFAGSKEPLWGGNGGGGKLSSFLPFLPLSLAIASGSKGSFSQLPNPWSRWFDSRKGGNLITFRNVSSRDVWRLGSWMCLGLMLFPCNIAKGVATPPYKLFISATNNTQGEVEKLQWLSMYGGQTNRDHSSNLILQYVGGMSSV